MAMTSDAEDDVDVEIWQRRARWYQLKIGLQIVFDNKRNGEWTEQVEGGVEVEVAATIFCLVSFRVSSFVPFLFLDWTIDNQITSKCGYIERQSKLYTCMCMCVSLDCQAWGYGWVGRTTCETGEERKAEGFLVSRNDVLVKDSCAAAS